MRHITPLGLLSSVPHQGTDSCGYSSILYVCTYQDVILKQLHGDIFPSKEGSKLSTQVLSFFTV